MCKGWNGRRQTPAVYPNLEKYIELHYSNYSAFAEAIGVHRSTIYTLMDGASDTKKSLIDAVLYETGMTYERCFQKRGERDV